MKDIKGNCEKCGQVIWKWQSYTKGYCDSIACDLIKQDKWITGIKCLVVGVAIGVILTMRVRG